MNLNGLISWLRFNNGVTDDFIKKNQWEVFGNPTVGTANAINGNALQLDGQSYLKLSSVELGGAGFEIDGWVYVDSSSPDYARLIAIVNPSNGFYLLSVRKSSTDSSKLDFWANSTADVSKDYGYSYTSDTVSIGQRVHFKLIYQRTTSYAYIKLCVNDKIAASWQSTFSKKIPEYNRQKFDIYIGAKSNGSQGLIGSIDEVTIYDGTWYAHNNGNVPTADHYQTLNLTLNADTLLKIKNQPLTWRYENYGSADLLTQAGTTLTNLPATQSKTGSAFYQPTRSKCFDIPATKEIWIKCDIYTTANYQGNDRIRIYSEDSNSVNGWTTQTPAQSTNYEIWHNGTSLNGGSLLGKNKSRPFLLHMKSDITDGVIEYFFIDGATLKWTGNVNNGDDFANVYIQMDGTNILVSNLIISNAPLEITDNVAELNVTRVNLNFDTCRQLQNTIDFFVDTMREIMHGFKVNLNADTIRNVRKTLSVGFETKKFVTNGDWRIENYGTLDIFPDDIYDRITKQFEVNSRESRTGSGVCLVIGTLETPPTDEIWIKFDFYLKPDDLITGISHHAIRVGSYDRVGLYENAVITKCQIGIDTQSQFYKEDYLAVGRELYTRIIDANLKKGEHEVNDAVARDAGLTIDADRIYRCLVHMKSDLNDGVIEFWLDDDYYSFYKGNVNDGKFFEHLYLNPGVYSYFLDPEEDNYYPYPLVSNIIISNAPVEINENVSTHIGGAIDVTFDTVRKILNGPLTWLYENYGTAELLAVEGVTVSDLEKHQSRTGSAFYTILDTTKNFPGKTFDTPPTKEIWMRFDVYIKDIINSSCTFFAGNIDYADNIYNSSGISFGVEATRSHYKLTYCSGDEINSGDRVGIYKVSLQDLASCLLYMKSDETNGIIKFWIDGTLREHFVGNVNSGNPFENICLCVRDEYYYIKSVKPLFSSVKISNSEIPQRIILEILDPTKNNFDLKRNVTVSVDLFFDTQREISSNGTWRYENYGTANLLNVDGITANLPKTAAIYQAGFHSEADEQNYFGISATKEVWIKFDFYFNRQYESLIVGSKDNYGLNQVRLNCASSNGDYPRIIYANNVSVQSDINHYFTPERLYRAVLHLKSDKTNGKIELFCSDGNIFNYTGNVNEGENFENIFIQSNNYNNISTYPYASNVIISNEEVGLNENAKMPLEINFDLLREISKIFDVESTFDLCRNVTLPQILTPDLTRKVVSTVELYNDTCFTIKSSIDVNFDTARTLPHKIHVMPIPLQNFSPLLGKKILKSNQSISALPSVEDISEGIQSIEITLSAQQLTDRINYVTVNPAQIMEQLYGQYLDYIFNVRFEKISERGVLYACKCCSDIDEILYRQLDYKIPEDTRWRKKDEQDSTQSDKPKDDEDEEPEYGWASTHISNIAQVMGKQPMLFFDDFVSTVDVEAGGVTYQDLISSIFGWTSRVPNVLINVFLRNDKLFVVQRGCEPNTIDLTPVKHTIANRDYELVRTAWGATVWSKTETKTFYVVPKIKGVSEVTWPTSSSSGSSKPKKKKKSDYSYADDGLVSKSVVEEGETKTVTDYYYVTIGKRKYLSEEKVTIYESGEKIDEKTTTHTYLGQGQTHSYTEDEDEEYVGGNVGSNKGDDRITPFQKKQYSVGPSIEKVPAERTIYGITPFDTSFPVAEDDKLAEITDHINWLNRKTKETVSMVVYDYPHLIDFTDKIIFEGNVYFLEMNTASTTQDIINRQEVSFTRWY